MYENHVQVSVLFPFKLSFYEKLGYKLVDELVYYQFKISDIKHQKTDYHMVEVDRLMMILEVSMIKQFSILIILQKDLK